MNEERFGREIRGLLNQGLDLSPAASARLAKGREAALQRQRVSLAARFGLAPTLVPAALGRTFGPLGPIGGAHWAVRWLLPVAIVAAGLFGYQNHIAQHQLEDDAPFTEIDSELLKSELPIDAYLDQGFKAWLRGDRVEPAAAAPAPDASARPVSDTVDVAAPQPAAGESAPAAAEGTRP